MKLARLAATAILSVSVLGYSWQLPGSEGSDYKKDEIVEIHADEMKSNTIAGFKFGIEDFWCKPSEDKQRTKLNIKDNRADEEREMINTSFYYQIDPTQNDKPKPLRRQCMRRYTKTEIDQFQFFSENNYHYRLWLDGLPSVTISELHRTQGGKHNMYEGIPIAIENKGAGPSEFSLINHLGITVSIAQHGNNTYRVVGFEVEPLSLLEDENRLSELKQDFNYEKNTLVHDKDYTYSWEVKTKIVPWGHRQDHFNKIEGHMNKVFHSQLLYTILVIVSLTFITYSSVAFVIRRDLQSIKDIEATQMTFMKERGHTKLEDFMTKSNQDSAYKAPTGNDDEDGEELLARRSALEAGLKKAAAFGGDQEVEDGLVWRKLKGDVMRAPACAQFFASILGTGAQVNFVYLILMAFYSMHMLSHLALRPILHLLAVLGLSATGFVAGYVLTYVLKAVKMTRDWQFRVGGVALAYPFYVVLTICAIDWLEWLQWSHEEYSVWTVFSTFGLWLVMGIPSTYIGASRCMLEQFQNVGNAQNKIPRSIPLLQPWYMDNRFVYGLSGGIIFACFYTPIHFMWYSIWRSERFSAFNYVLIFSVLLIIVISELSVIWTFLGLRNGDYRWQWRSFMVGASSMIYFGAFALYYMVAHLNLKLLSDDLVYLLWSSLFLVSTLLMTGTISAFASAFFVRYIYDQKEKRTLA